MDLPAGNVEEAGLAVEAATGRVAGPFP
jgi:hypothetical protein